MAWGPLLGDGKREGTGAGADSRGPGVGLQLTSPAARPPQVPFPVSSLRLITVPPGGGESRCLKPQEPHRPSNPQSTHLSQHPLVLSREEGGLSVCKHFPGPTRRPAPEPPGLLCSQALDFLIRPLPPAVSPAPARSLRSGFISFQGKFLQEPGSQGASQTPGSLGRGRPYSLLDGQMPRRLCQSRAQLRRVGSGTFRAGEENPRGRWGASSASAHTVPSEPSSGKRGGQAWCLPRTRRATRASISQHLSAGPGEQMSPQGPRVPTAIAA